MIGLSAAVCCCFQLSLCLAMGLLYEGRHLSLPVRRKITVNVFFNVYKRYFIIVTFFMFLTFFNFWGTFFHL